MNQHKRPTLTSTRTRADLDHFLDVVDLDPFVIIFHGVDWMSPFADKYHEGPSASKMLVQVFAVRSVLCLVAIVANVWACMILSFLTTSAVCYSFLVVEHDGETLVA